MSTRRKFLKSLAVGGVGAMGFSRCNTFQYERSRFLQKPDIANIYKGESLGRIAFPIGGIGTGMFCLEGNGAISNMSIRHVPEIFNEPAIFAAISFKDRPDMTRVIEGPVANWKRFGQPRSALGKHPTTWGLPRFNEVDFKSHFPFAEISLRDKDLPVKVVITGWSPFTPNDPDDSGLPFGVLEYSFRNDSSTHQELLFSYHAEHFIGFGENEDNRIRSHQNGFILSAKPDHPKKKEYICDLAIFTDQDDTLVDHCWFRGGWFDGQRIAWNSAKNFKPRVVSPINEAAHGASLYVPFILPPNSEKTIKLFFNWYVPETSIRHGKTFQKGQSGMDAYQLGLEKQPFETDTYIPYYAVRFQSIEALSQYCINMQQELREKSKQFSVALFESTLPVEIKEAVASNLSILKSPTVLRQHDGRFWTYEGSGDTEGSCHGSCTHVWNYAQAVPHLFPSLERSLRNTEFCENQTEDGFQSFRANLPITPVRPTFHAAADGQLGGIMKVYRDWRISADDDWLRKLYPRIKNSIDYCIRQWDPNHLGTLKEPHHNTYDVEFWGADGMCTSIYLGALLAFSKITSSMGDDAQFYTDLYQRGKKFMENELYNGEYFIQQVQWKDLKSDDPNKVPSMLGDYSEEAKAILETEGPKYQYGNGCLSDGVIGAWMARVCGLGDILDPVKVRSHLLAVYQYNFKHDLSRHVNNQRTTFGFGNEPGLILCSWPKGHEPSLPFVYSDEVWTGIEYQVAAHLIMMGEMEKGLEIIRAVRKRYDGRFRNPFNEYEFGAWYARALSSYSLLQAYTGLFYDAKDKTLYISSKYGDFTCMINTVSGMGMVNLSNEKVILSPITGEIFINRLVDINNKTL